MPRRCCAKRYPRVPRRRRRDRLFPPSSRSVGCASAPKNTKVRLSRNRTASTRGVFYHPPNRVIQVPERQPPPRKTRPARRRIGPGSAYEVGSERPRPRTKTLTTHSSTDWGATFAGHSFRSRPRGVRGPPPILNLRPHTRRLVIEIRQCLVIHPARRHTVT